MGYHKNKIPKGEYGEFSKIEEEFLEFKDAYEQRNQVLSLVELSDLIGAIGGFLQKYHRSISFVDLISMANSTKEAFEDGTRKS